MLNTPSGSLILFIIFAKILVTPDTFSEGLSMKVFPVVIASGKIDSGTITGNFLFVTPAHTPIGTLIYLQLRLSWIF